MLSFHEWQALSADMQRAMFEDEAQAASLDETKQFVRMRFPSYRDTNLDHSDVHPTVQKMYPDGLVMKLPNALVCDYAGYMVLARWNDRRCTRCGMRMYYETPDKWFSWVCPIGVTLPGHDHIELWKE